LTLSVNSVLTFLFDRIRCIITNLLLVAKLGWRLIFNLNNRFQLFGLFLFIRNFYNFFLNSLFLVFTSLSRNLGSFISILINDANLDFFKIQCFHLWLWFRFWGLLTNLNKLWRFDILREWLCRNSFLKLELLGDCMI